MLPGLPTDCQQERAVGPRHEVPRVVWPRVPRRGVEFVHRRGSLPPCEDAAVGQHGQAATERAEGPPAAAAGDLVEAAIREGQRAVALHPGTKDGYLGPYYQHQLARIFILVGEHEKALDQLEPLLNSPYFLSPGWLKIDPNFDPLRSNPRFQKLVAASK